MLPALGCPVLGCNDRSDPKRGFTEQLRATSVIEVVPPAPGQTLGKADYCSLPKQLAKWLGVALGDQIRIYRNDNEYALYTVRQLRDETSPATVRMKKSGRKRLGTVNSFVGQIDTRVVIAEFTDAEARAQSEFVERLVDDGVHAGLLVAAPHGGKIELNTDLQAEYLASRLSGVSSWICKGWNDPDGAYTRWHVRSKDVSPNSFAGLGTIANRGFRHAVTFHGMSEPGVIIGGQAPEKLREALRAAIVAAIGDLQVPVVVAGHADLHGGFDPANFVNWVTGDGLGGIQIEQGTLARNLYWREIADAVGSVLGPML